MENLCVLTAIYRVRVNIQKCKQKTVQVKLLWNNITNKIVHKLLSDNCHDIPKQNNYAFVMYKMRFEHKNKNLTDKTSVDSKTKLACQNKYYQHSLSVL